MVKPPLASSSWTLTSDLSLHHYFPLLFNNITLFISVYSVAISEEYETAALKKKLILLILRTREGVKIWLVHNVSTHSQSNVSMIVLTWKNKSVILLIKVLLSLRAETSVFCLSKIVCCTFGPDHSCCTSGFSQFFCTVLVGYFLSQNTNSRASSLWWWIYDRPDEKSVLRNGCSQKIDQRLGGQRLLCNKLWGC